MEVSELAPLADDQVSIFIDGGAMGGIANPISPLVLRKAEICALLFVGIISHLGCDIAVFIQNGDAPLEFGKDSVIASNLNSGRHAQVPLNHFDEIAIEVPIFDPVIVPVAHQQQWLALASVQPDAMAGFKFPVFLTRTAEGLYEFAVLIVLEHVIGTITIRHEDRAIRSDSYGAGIESFFVFINPSFFWVFDGPFGVAIHGQLHNLVIGRARAVDIFFALLFANFQAVNPRRPEGANEFALGRENDNPAWGIRGDVNVSGFVDYRAPMAGAKLLPIGLFIKKIRFNFVFDLCRAAKGAGESEKKNVGKAVHSFDKFADNLWICREIQTNSTELRFKTPTVEPRRREVGAQGEFKKTGFLSEKFM